MLVQQRIIVMLVVETETKLGAGWRIRFLENREFHEERKEFIYHCDKSLARQKKKHDFMTTEFSAARSS